jgi:hypothetical protein
MYLASPQNVGGIYVFGGLLYSVLLLIFRGVCIFVGEVGLEGKGPFFTRGISIYVFLVVRSAALHIISVLLIGMEMRK